MRSECSTGLQAYRNHNMLPCGYHIEKQHGVRLHGGRTVGRYEKAHSCRPSPLCSPNTLPARSKIILLDTPRP